MTGTLVNSQICATTPLDMKPSGRWKFVFFERYQIRRNGPLIAWSRIKFMARYLRSVIIYKLLVSLAKFIPIAISNVYWIFSMKVFWSCLKTWNLCGEKETLTLSLERSTGHVGKWTPFLCYKWLGISKEALLATSLSHGLMECNRNLNC